LAAAGYGRRMASSFRYVILGAGRQGTAAAYDLVLRGDAAEVVLADREAAVAERAADRVNRLTGQKRARALAVDAADPASLARAMAGASVVLSAVPYHFNVAITRAAIAQRVHLCDMGGHTGVVREQLALHAEAERAGVSILPDCGMGPGLINVLAVHAMDQLDQAREIYVWDGGLPQEPKPPWNYQCAFHLNGLTNEYDGMVPLLRDGRIVDVEALSEPLTVDLPPLGTFESFIAAGGSTAPWSFLGRLQRFETRILRHPGHYEWFRAFKTLGLFGEQPIEVRGQKVVPRDVLHALLAPRITAEVVKDVCLMRCKGVGRKDGRDTTVLVTLVDRYDPTTGMPAMERLTGWHCAIMMAMQARGTVPPGARALEALLLAGTPTAAAVLAEVAARGIHWSVEIA
jgi:lysine 6-dehydrogenase